MTNPTPSPTERAALLGTEHGTQAAREWWTSHTVDGLMDFAGSIPMMFGEVPKDWPRIETMLEEEHDALPDQIVGLAYNDYCEAFTAAVESTIRQACQEVTK